MDSNVLDITPHLPERPALDVDLPLAIVQRLHAVNKIDSDAYHLGLIVIAKFQEVGEFRCELTRVGVQRTYTLLDGEPVGAPANSELEDFCNALRRLQHMCGIHSHIKAERVGKSSRHNHFTEQYLHKDPEELYKVVKSDRPIYFEWKPEDADALVEDVRQNITHSMMIARFAEIRTTKG